MSANSTNNQGNTYTTEKFTSTITDFFDITNNNEIKATGIIAIVKEIEKVIVDRLIDAGKLLSKDDIKSLELKTAGFGVAFNFALGTVDVLIDSRDRSGASKHLYAKPDLNLLKLLIKGMVSGVVDITVTSKIKPAKHILSQVGMNLALGSVTSKVYDAFFCGQYVTLDFTESKNSDIVLERKYIVDDSLSDTLKDHWNNIENDIKTLDRVIVKSDDSSGNIIYYKKLKVS